MNLKPTFTSLSPNTEKEDILLALKLIFQPWGWEKDKALEKLELGFKNYLGIRFAVSFNSGRSALMAILNSLNLEKDNEVLLQAFTCNAAVNPILWSNLKPVFVDIDERTLNLDIEDLKRKITSKSKVVMVQHTFGLPADLDKVLEICQKNNLILIEDCAHSLGAFYGQRKVGAFGQAAFFSFGRDKVISCVYGGIAVTNDDQLAEKLQKFQEQLPGPSRFWIWQQLLHPILSHYLIMPLYNFSELGRWLLLFFQKTGVLSKAVHNLEKKGRQPKYIPRKIPGALAKLALMQFSKLKKFNKHRELIAGLYEKNLSRIHGLKLPRNQAGRVWWRYPVLVSGADTSEILEKFRKEKIFLDDGWRKAIVVPPDTDQEAMGYKKGSCPVAEKVAESILNLPTHINVGSEEAERITALLKKFLKQC